MSANGYLQLAFYLVVLTALARPLGGFMARVFEGQPLGRAVDRTLGGVERSIYRVCGIRPDEDMGWKTYAARCSSSTSPASSSSTCCSACRACCR